MLASSNAAAVVPVQRGHLLGEVRPHDVQPAVGVVVADADAHAGQGDAVFVERAAGRNRDLPERPVMIVAIQQARRAVAGDVDVRPSVVVEIRRRRAHPVRARRLPVAADEDHRGRPARTGDPRRFRDVGECAVAAVAIEDVRAAGEPQRPAGNRDVVVAAVAPTRPAGAPSPDRSSRSWRRTDPDDRHGRSPENSSPRPSVFPIPRRRPLSETSVNVPSPLLWYSTLWPQ